MRSAWAGRWVVTALCVAWAAGCVDVPAEEAVPTEPVPLEFSEKPAVPGDGAEAIALPADAGPPSVTVLAPEAGASVPGATVRLRARIVDDVGVVSASVRVGGNAASWLDPRGELADLDVMVAVPPGPVEIELAAWDAAGNRGAATVQVVRGAAADAEAPVVAIEAPAEGGAVAAATVVVRGTASDDVAVARVDVVTDVPGADAVTATTVDHFATWQAVVPVAPAGPTTILVIAWDAAGRSGEASVVVAGGVGDTEPPSLAVATPVDGAVVDTWALAVTGSASDAVGVADVAVRAGGGSWVTAKTADGFATWSATLTLAPGEHVVDVVARDSAGNTATTTRTVTYALPAGLSAPTHHALTWAPPGYPEVTLTLDRAKLQQALPPASAEQIVLLELDPTAMLESAVGALKGECGEGWGVPEFTPGCPADWGSSETNMWRLLTMTPATSNVQGTSFAAMEDIAQWLADNPVDGGPEVNGLGDMLAVALDTPVGASLIGTGPVAEAIRRNVIGSHPAAPGGLLPVTLQDGFDDMAGFVDRFGPAGGHPGFIDPDVPVVASVMTDAFALEVSGVSNLHWHDGLELGAGKGRLAFVAEGADDVLAMDFLGEDSFGVIGLAEAPVVDLGFTMVEHDGWLTAGETLPDAPCLGPGPGPWTGDVPPWAIELVVGCAAKRQFEAYVAGCDLCALDSGEALIWGIYPEDTPLEVDLFEIVIGTAGHSKDGVTPAYFPPLADNPPGFMRLWTVQQNGYPPDVTTDTWEVGFVWELLTEVAQRRLQDGGVAEGDGDVRFVLEDVSVGLTADELVAQIRPFMESQKGFLSAEMLGQYAANADSPDVFLARQGDGALWLAHTAAGDPASHTFGGFVYATDAFFADLQLTQPTGQVVALPPLDTPHHALLLKATPQVAYTLGRDGQVYRLEARATGPSAAQVTVQAVTP